MPYPVINGGFGYMEKGTYFGNLIQRFVSKAGRFVHWLTSLWDLSLCNFLADHLLHGLLELFWLVREQYRGNVIPQAHGFFHDFSDLGQQYGPRGRGKEAKYT